MNPLPENLDRELEIAIALDALRGESRTWDALRDLRESGPRMTSERGRYLLELLQAINKPSPR